MRGFLKRFMAPYRVRVAIGILAKGVEVVFDLMTPVIVAQMIDLGVATRDDSAAPAARKIPLESPHKAWRFW